MGQKIVKHSLIAIGLQIVKQSLIGRQSVKHSLIGQEAEVDKMTTFDLDLYLGGEGHGVQGQICDIWTYGSDIRSMSSIRPIFKCRCPPLVGRYLNSLAKFYNASYQRLQNSL